MSTIVTRAGKGTPLTNNEVDSNFTNLNTDKIQVTADRNMLKTIVRNLVINAIKFTRKNGRIELLALPKKDKIEVSVLDNGIGMTVEESGKLFDINPNKTKNGTNNEPGTGLGLLLCRDLVIKHDGRIWAESEPDKGSCVKFTLPESHNLPERNS